MKRHVGIKQFPNAPTGGVPARRKYVKAKKSWGRSKKRLGVER